MRDTGSKGGSGLRKSAGILLALCLIAIIALLGWISSCRWRASPPPSPTLTVMDSPDGFPSVDWAYWEGVNPDIVGWVTIPATNIDHPIVQASADAPDFYLDHDAFRQSNPLGCPYLDADCRERGFDSLNAVIFGHHWSTGEMFADIAKYGDEAFLREHPMILLQTPYEKLRLGVSGVSIVKGTDRTKRTSFESAMDFSAWLDARRQESRLWIDDRDSATIHRVISFVTCSYTTWTANERTIVYASR